MDSVLVTFVICITVIKYLRGSTSGEDFLKKKICQLNVRGGPVHHGGLWVAKQRSSHHDRQESQKRRETSKKGLRQAIALMMHANDLLATIRTHLMPMISPPYYHPVRD